MQTLHKQAGQEQEIIKLISREIPRYTQDEERSLTLFRTSFLVFTEQLLVSYRPLLDVPKHFISVIPKPNMERGSYKILKGR